ncbi:MAG: hypothetical protein M1493_08175 [Firmicutes bacterium]|nr:hypothetical protein [Bacillota bacterium]
MRSRGSRSGFYRGNFVRFLANGGLGNETRGAMHDSGLKVPRFDGLTAGAPQRFATAMVWLVSRRLPVSGSS